MTTSPPPPVTDLFDDEDQPEPPRVRRFGAARALGLGLAAFVGGYLAQSALSDLVGAIRDDALTHYNFFDGDAEKNRNVLNLAANGLGALAGVIAVLGLALRRWAVGVLVVTLLSMLAGVGYFLLTLDSNWRDHYLEPANWSPRTGALLLFVVLGLQALIVLLALIRGPKLHEPAEPSGPDVAIIPPPVPQTDEDDRMAGPEDLATQRPAETPPPVAAPVVIDESRDDGKHIDDALDDEPVEDPYANDDTALDEQVGDDEPVGPPPGAHAAPVEDEVPDEVFLVIHGQEYGPYPPERVRGFMVEGRIHPGTLVRVGEETKPAAQVPSIFG